MAKTNRQLRSDASTRRKSVSATGNRQLKQLVPLLLNWFAANARDLPWRRTRNPYAVWVSEIMLQQTQVKTVLPYWQCWMRELPTIKAVAEASPDKIHKLWEGLGYYTRARNLQKAARQIVVNCRRRGNESRIKDKSEPPYVGSYKFPETFDQVLALPGIGRYTAGAICSIAFNQPLPILDGNVIRVLTRIFGIAENPREKKTNAQLWNLAEKLVSHAKTLSSQRKIIPKNLASFAPLREASLCSSFNQSLMELGALICTARNPQCRICPLKRFCIAFKENRVEQLPNLGNRPTITNRHFVAFVVERNGRFLVRQRPAKVVNAHLWEFPNVEIGARLFKPQRTDTRKKLLRAKNPRFNVVTEAARQIAGVAPKEISSLCTIKHSITRYRITLDAFRVQLKKTPRKVDGVWRTPAQMEKSAFSSAHKQILARLRSPSASGATPETTRGTRVLP